MSEYDKKSCQLCEWKRKPRSLTGVYHDSPINWHVMLFTELYTFNNEIGKVIDVDNHGFRFIPNSQVKKLIAFYNQCDNKEDFIKFLDDNYQDIDAAFQAKIDKDNRKSILKELTGYKSVRKQLKDNGISIKDFIENG